MKVGKETLFEVYVNVWRVNVIVTYGKDKKFFKGAFKDQPKEHEEKIKLIKKRFFQLLKDKSAASYNHYEKEDIHYIHINPQESIYELANVVSHEALHATFSILTARGLEYCTHSEESYTYLQGYLVEHILRKILEEDAP